MSQIEITVTKVPEIKDVEFLWSKLREHGLSLLSNPNLEEKFVFGIFAKQGEEILGGLLGQVYYKGMHVQLLWVSESLRKTGIGSSLLQRAEDLARESSCTLIYLDTFSFQAPKFYEKWGFEIFGKIENFPDTYTRYFLVKRIS
jgi:GNAT superfamily N-acetyltransferase